jgi:hypothetical protein
MAGPLFGFAGRMNTDALQEIAAVFILHRLMQDRKLSK